MRAFIALDIPDVFQESLVCLSQQLSQNVQGRFMKSDTYHVTLAFLGEIEEAHTQTIASILDNLSTRHQPITLCSVGLSKFGKSHDTTLVLELKKSNPLISLVNDLREQLTAHEIPFDTKTFRPRITLARRASIPSIHFDCLSFPRNEQTNSLTLYKSTLSSKGAHYKVLYQTQL